MMTESFTQRSGGVTMITNGDQTNFRR